MRNAIFMRNIIAGASCMLVAAVSVLASAMANSIIGALLLLAFALFSFGFGVHFFAARVVPDETNNTNS